MRYEFDEISYNQYNLHTFQKIELMEIKLYILATTLLVKLGFTSTIKLSSDVCSISDEEPIRGRVSQNEEDKQSRDDSPSVLQKHQNLIIQRLEKIMEEQKQSGSSGDKSPYQLEVTSKDNSWVMLKINSAITPKKIKSLVTSHDQSPSWTLKHSHHMSDNISEEEKFDGSKVKKINLTKTKFSKFSFGTRSFHRNFPKSQVTSNHDSFNEEEKVYSFKKIVEPSLMNCVISKWKQNVKLDRFYNIYEYIIAQI